MPSIPKEVDIVVPKRGKSLEETVSIIVSFRDGRLRIVFCIESVRNEYYVIVVLCCIVLCDGILYRIDVVQP